MKQVTYTVYSHPDPDTYEYAGNYVSKRDAVKAAKVVIATANYDVAHIALHIVHTGGQTSESIITTVDSKGVYDA